MSKDSSPDEPSDLVSGTQDSGISHEDGMSKDSSLDEPSDLVSGSKEDGISQEDGMSKDSSLDEPSDLVSRSHDDGSSQEDGMSHEVGMSNRLMSKESSDPNNGAGLAEAAMAKEITKKAIIFTL